MLLMTVACVGVGVYPLVYPPGIEVLVATEHLDLKAEITKTNVKFQRWPADLVPEGAITSTEGIPAGKFIQTRLRKGQPSLEMMLLIALRFHHSRFQLAWKL